MHRSPMLLVALMFFASALAGCTSGDDDSPRPGPSDDGPDDPGGNGTAGPGGGGAGVGGGSGGGTGTNGTSPGSGANGTDGGDNSTWTYDNRTGDVNGIGLGADSPGTDETFDVGPDVVTLSIDVGVEGDTLDVEVRPPDCTDSSCASTGSASEGGNYTVSLPMPGPGSWTVVLTAPGLGPQSSSYLLTIGQESGPAGNGTASSA